MDLQRVLLHVDYPVWRLLAALVVHANFLYRVSSILYFGIIVSNRVFCRCNRLVVETVRTPTDKVINSNLLTKLHIIEKCMLLCRQWILVEPLWVGRFYYSVYRCHFSSGSSIKPLDDVVFALCCANVLIWYTAHMIR